MKYLNILFKKKYVIKYIEIKLKNIFERINKTKNNRNEMIRRFNIKLIFKIENVKDKK